MDLDYKPSGISNFIHFHLIINYLVQYRCTDFSIQFLHQSYDNDFFLVHHVTVPVTNELFCSYESRLKFQLLELNFITILANYDFFRAGKPNFDQQRNELCLDANYKLCSYSTYICIDYIFNLGRLVTYQFRSCSAYFCINHLPKLE